MIYNIRGKQYENLTNEEYLRLHSLDERMPNPKKKAWSFKCHHCGTKWSSKEQKPYYIGGKHQCDKFCSEICALNDYDGVNNEHE